MNSILVLQLNRMGDLVQTLPLLKRLRDEYPQAKITLACLRGLQDLLESVTFHDRLLALGPHTVSALGNPEKQKDFPHGAPFDDCPEFRERYDLLVNVTSDFESAYICRNVEAEKKMGRIHTVEGELRLLGDWSKYLFSLVTNRTENLFNIVDIQVGIAGLAPKPQTKYLPVPQYRREEARGLLRSQGRSEIRSDASRDFPMRADSLRPCGVGAAGAKRLVALQTGASDLHRAWSLENFAAVARGFLTQGDAQILLVGDGREQARAQELQAMIGLPVINLTGLTSLSLLPAVMAECDLLISNDTGTIHIAAAVGTRTVGLYFSTAFYTETAPYGPDHVILQVELPCSPCSASSRCPEQACRPYLAPDAVLEVARWCLGGPLPSHRPNLFAYRSLFLDNGSLMYLPLHTEVSPQYLRGLMGRLMWEESLAMAREHRLGEEWHRLRWMPEWEARRLSMLAALETLGGLFARGLDLAEGLELEFSQALPRREKVMAQHQELASLGASMAAAANQSGLFGNFLKYEMMDMDYAPYPALAGLLEEKYSTLNQWVVRFRSALSDLSA